MMQGGYIEHCALPCHGAREQITMVTSFRAKGKIFRDMSNLKTIRSCSNSFEMYDQVSHVEEKASLSFMHELINLPCQFVHSRLDVVQGALDIYRRRLKNSRNIIEDTYGRRGGLKRPTVDLSEFESIVTVINDTLSNAHNQMSEF